MFKEIRDYLIALSIIGIAAYLVNQYLIMQLVLLTLSWFTFFGFEYALNGGSIKRCFPEDLLLYGFKGQSERAKFAKKQLNPKYNSTICGAKKKMA